MPITYPHQGSQVPDPTTDPPVDPSGPGGIQYRHGGTRVLDPRMAPIADTPSTGFPVDEGSGRPPLFWSENFPDLAWMIDWGQVPGLPTLDDYQADIQAVEDATYERFRSRLDPMFAQRETAMNEQLAGRGLPAGASANIQMRDQFGRDLSDAYNMAAQQATLAGRQEHSRLFDLGMRAHRQGLSDQLAELGLANRARGQAFQEQMGTRQQLFSELANMLGQSQFNPYMFNPPSPGAGPGMGPGVNVPGAYQANQYQYGAPGYGNIGAMLGNFLYNYYSNPNNQDFLSQGNNPPDIGGMPPPIGNVYDM